MKIKIPTMKARIVEYYVGRFVLWFLYRTKAGRDILDDIRQVIDNRWREHLERKVKRDCKEHETRVKEHETRVMRYLTRYLQLAADYLHKHGTDNELIRDAFQHANRKAGYHVAPHKNPRPSKKSLNEVVSTKTNRRFKWPEN